MCCVNIFLLFCAVLFCVCKVSLQSFNIMPSKSLLSVIIVIIIILYPNHSAAFSRFSLICLHVYTSFVTFASDLISSSLQVSQNRSVSVSIAGQPGAQPQLKNWGGPRFGSQHRGTCVPRPVKGRDGFWVRERVALPLWGSGGVTPGNFENSRCYFLHSGDTCC